MFEIFEEEFDWLEDRVIERLPLGHEGKNAAYVFLTFVEFLAVVVVTLPMLFVGTFVLLSEMIRGK